jgi:hypothetical protein
MRRIGQGLFTGGFQTVDRIFISQLQQTHTGFISLLFDFEGSKNGFDRRNGMGPDFLGPFNKAITISLQVFLMILRHMCLKHTVLVGAAIEAFVGADPLIVVEHFDN